MFLKNCCILRRLKFFWPPHGAGLARPRGGGGLRPPPSRQGSYTSPYGWLRPPYGMAGCARPRPVWVTAPPHMAGFAPPPARGKAEGVGFARHKAGRLRQAPSRQGHYTTPYGPFACQLDEISKVFFCKKNCQKKV